MRIALVQLTSGNEVAPNTSIVCDYIRGAAAAGARFISTPETTHLMEMDRQEVLKKASFEEKDAGLAAFQSLAAELDVWLHIGSLIIKVADDKLANRSFLISPTGEITARYDKAHLFDVELGGGESYRESALYQPGNATTVVDVEGMKVGLSVCYDLRFPYLYRDLAQAGANVLLVPAAFTQPTGEAHWHVLLRARAIENGCFVLAAAQTGMHATGRGTYGHSLAIDPWGGVIADAGEEAGFTIVDLDLAMIEKVRQKIPSLTHDRPVSVKL